MGRYRRTLFVASLVFKSSDSFIFPSTALHHRRRQTDQHSSKVALPRSGATLLHGTMLRKSLLQKVAGQKRKRPLANIDDIDRSTPVISLEFLDGVTREAIFRQRRILEALQEQEDKQQTQKANATANNIDGLNKRRKQVTESMDKLHIVQKEIRVLQLSSMAEVDIDTLQSVKGKLVELGFEALLSQGPSDWRHVQELCRNSKQEFGRPADFTGLVFKSPLGVPILVGRKGAHNDEVLRRISQGSDLWFQVEDYGGSRVLLRTSLARGMKNSKSCMQAAADVAAYYSDYRRKFETVPVMYTDSKRVAKRGSKTGQMRKRKSLGTIYGNPQNAFDMCRGKEP